MCKPKPAAAAAGEQAASGDAAAQWIAQAKAENDTTAVSAAQNAVVCTNIL